MADQKRILYVEDDQNLAKILTKWISSKTHHQIDHVTDADEGLELAMSQYHAENPYDMAILDILLKTHTKSTRVCEGWEYHEKQIENGFQLGQILQRSKEYNSSLPIVFLSATLKEESHIEKLANKVEAIYFRKSSAQYQQITNTVIDVLGKSEPGYWHKISKWVGLDWFIVYFNYCCVFYVKSCCKEIGVPFFPMF